MPDRRLHDHTPNHTARRHRPASLQGKQEDMLTIQTRTVNTVTILDLSGHIIIGSGDAILREGVSDCLEQDRNRILLNLAAVKTIDESGVGELVSAYTTTVNRGGKLKLLNLPPKIQDILTITKLIMVFETYADEEEAVESFG